MRTDAKNTHLEVSQLWVDADGNGVGAPPFINKLQGLHLPQVHD